MTVDSRRKKVVITGMGVVSPYGLGSDVFFSSLSRGISGISEVNKIDTSKISAKYGGEIKWYNPNDFFTKNQQEKMDINSQYIIVATNEALQLSNIQMNDEDKANMGVFLGTLTAGLPFTEEYYKQSLEGRYYPTLISQFYRSSATHNLASYFGITGPRITITTACSASSHAIGLATSYIKAGKINSAIVGGVDGFCNLTWAGFNSLRNISPKEPRPFSKDRQGMIIGEGSGVLILENEEDAIKRGAKIYGEVKGWGASADAYHITGPKSEGDTIALAIKNAIKNAKLDVDDINYIAAHGTGTLANDSTETNAIKNVFNEKAYSIPISSIKSMIGHTMGAAGIHQAIAVIGMMRDKMIYPTINYSIQDPKCDLNYVPNSAIEANIENAISNSFGFGGNNSVLVLSKYAG